MPLPPRRVRGGDLRRSEGHGLHALPKNLSREASCQREDDLVRRGWRYTKHCGNQRAGTALSSQEPVAPAPGAEVSFAHARMRMRAGAGAKTPEPVVGRPQPQNTAQKAPHLSPTCSLPAPLQPPLLRPLQPEVRPR